MLAGGLNIKNLKKAVELTGAPIVDISSGVEVEKGVKCPEKIKELIRYVKRVDSQKFKEFNFHDFPDKNGRFGKFGGRFVAETLMPLLLDVEKEYEKAKKSVKFLNEIDYYFKNYVGRPSPLYFAERLSKSSMVLRFILKETN